MRLSTKQSYFNSITSVNYLAWEGKFLIWTSNKFLLSELGLGGLTILTMTSKLRYKTHITEFHNYNIYRLDRRHFGSKKVVREQSNLSYNSQQKGIHAPTKYEVREPDLHLRFVPS